MVYLSKQALLSLLPLYMSTVVLAQASGSGTTTRYWDCCKPSCAWPGKTTLAAGAVPVETCNLDEQTTSDPNAASGCGGGTAFMPATESPWAVNDTMAYGYAAVNIAGGTEESWCCACYELTFTSTALAGKKMIVQATNTGGDLGSNQFDISIPGGGVGLFNGCTAQWGAPSGGWGAQYGGVSDVSACSALPAALQPGCDFRFDWFMGADNPTVDFVQVTCPAALTAKTGCVRAGETPTGSTDTSTVSTVASSSPVATYSPPSSSLPEAPVASSSPVATYSPPTSSSLPEAPVASSSPVATYSPPTSSSLPEAPVASSSPSETPIAPYSTAAVAPLASSSSESAAETSSVEPTSTTSETITTYTTVYVVPTTNTVYSVPATTSTTSVEVEPITVTVYDDSECSSSSSSVEPVVTLTVYTEC